jgi:drug/metabolite transporter (DMT)-like permease
VVVVGGWLLLRGRSLRLSGKAAVTGSLWLGALQLLTSFGYVASVAYIPVSLSAIIFYTAPIIVGVLAAATGREPMTLVKAVALIAAFVGLALSLGPSFTALDPLGIGLAAAAAMSLALVILLGGIVIRRTEAILLTFWMNVWMLLAVGLYALAAGGVGMPQGTVGIVGAAGATACSVIGFAAWFAGMAMIGPVRVALTFNIEPVVTVMTAAALLGERLGPAQLLGGALVLAALIATALAGRR